MNRHRRKSREVRRSKLRMLGALAVLALIAGACADNGETAPPPPADDGADADGDAPPPEPEPLAVHQCVDEQASEPQPGDEIVVQFGGGFVQSTWLEQIIPAFEASTGLRVVYQAAVQNEAGAQVVAQGGNVEWDLMIMNDETIEEARQTGVIEAIEVDALEALSEIPPGGDIELVHEGSVSVLIGTFGTGITYNIDAFEAEGLDPPTSVLDLFESPYRERFGLYAPPQRTGLQFVRQVNRLIGADPGDVTPALEKIAQELRPHVAAVEAALGPMQQALQDGRVWVYYDSTVTSGLTHLSGAVNLGMVFPEGDTWVAGQWPAIPTGADNKAGACVMLNWLLTVEGQEAFALQNFIPVRPDAQIPEQFIPFSPNVDVQHVNVLNEGTPDIEEITELFNQIVGPAG